MILLGEILSWSLLGVKGLSVFIMTFTKVQLHMKNFNKFSYKTHFVFFFCRIGIKEVVRVVSLSTDME